MNKKRFVERRNRIIDAMKDHSVLILFSGIKHKASADNEFEFVVNSNFFYLTGINQPNSTLVISKSDQEVTTHLFIDRFDELKEKWTGRILKTEEAIEISAINNILYSDMLEAKITDLLSKKTSYGIIDNMYLDLEDLLFIQPKVTTQDYKLTLEQKYNKTVLDIHHEIILLRMVKDEDEIEELSKSIALTDKALKHLMKYIKNGVYEYQVAALFEYILQDNRAKLAFDTIAACGKNATILHYPQLDAKLENNKLLLLDLGANLTGYNADISRTYPVGGVYKGLEKVIYEIVLSTNKAVINYIKPGRTIVDLQMFTIQYMTSKLLEAKLIQHKDEISKYYYHGVSHHLGIDVHDQSDRSLKLVPGNVITVEPGLYFAELGIGVRIEDDVLVTNDGAKNLSINIIKEIKDIENFMKN